MLFRFFHISIKGTAAKINAHLQKNTISFLHGAFLKNSG